MPSKDPKDFGRSGDEAAPLAAPDLSAIRTEYARAGLTETDLDPSPAVQIDRWLREAIRAAHPEPTAMTVATVSADGAPSARIVLLKALDAAGLVFYTGYGSAKGRDLEANPRAAATLFWALLERQIRVRGEVSKTSRAESEAYFRSRPHESQLGAWASAQSDVIADRAALEKNLADVRARFASGEVPCPPFWGGFRIALDVVELWQGRPSRLHDRLVYRRDGDSYRIERLAP